MSPETAGRMRALNEFGLYFFGPLGIIFIIVSVVMFIIYRRRKHRNALLAKDGVKISGKIGKVDFPRDRRRTRFCRVSYYFTYADRQWDGIQSVNEYYIYKMKLAQGSVIDILCYPLDPFLSRIEACELETSFYSRAGIVYL